MIRAIITASAATVVFMFLGSMTGGTLAGGDGAGFGALAGAAIGMGMGFRYVADRAAVAAAQREFSDPSQDQAHGEVFRSNPHRIPEDHRYRMSSSLSRRGLWLRLTRRQQNVPQGPYSRLTNQRHHDLDLTDIGIHRKKKKKR